MQKQILRFYINCCLFVFLSTLIVKLHYLYHASLSHEDALENLGQVSKVKGIMGLGWSWEELVGDGRIDSDCGIYDCLFQWLDCFYWY